MFEETKDMAPVLQDLEGDWIVPYVERFRKDLEIFELE
jgi:hypothetical protein